MPNLIPPYIRPIADFIQNNIKKPTPSGHIRPKPSIRQLKIHALGSEFSFFRIWQRYTNEGVFLGIKKDFLVE